MQVEQLIQILFWCSTVSGVLAVLFGVGAVLLYRFAPPARMKEIIQKQRPAEPEVLPEFIPEKPEPPAKPKKRVIAAYMAPDVKEQLSRLIAMPTAPEGWSGQQ